MKHVACSFVHLKWSGGGAAKGVVAKGNEAKAPRVTQKQPRLADHFALKVKSSEHQILLAQKPKVPLQAEITAWRKPLSRLTKHARGQLCTVPTVLEF